MALTAAQVARLSALTGNWTEPLTIKCAGRAMLDDGRIVEANEVEGLVGDSRCLVLAAFVGLPNVYRNERLVGNTIVLNPRDFDA